MKIVFFDGYCSVCNILVDWLMRIDKSGQLTFASLQGETAAQLLGSRTKPIDTDTVIYLSDGEIFERSTAVLRILFDVGGLWRLTAIFFIVPEFFRNLIYRIIAKNRYRILKKRETCRVPTRSESNRLLP